VGRSTTLAQEEDA